MTRFARRFRKVGRSLSRVELMRSSMDETFALTDIDLLDKDAGRRFLDFYGDEGLRIAFERYGFFDAIRERGYGELFIETWAHDERHTLMIDGLPAAGGERARLLELTVRRDRLRVDVVDGHPPIERIFDVLTVDWLTLRHPLGAFRPDRLRLPGQDSPGLGVGERVLELLYRVVDRLGLHGLVTVAEYFHNAVLYARELPYVDPLYMGQLRALERLLFEREHLDLAQATWAICWGYVLGEDDASFRWRGEAMVQTREPELADYLTSKPYAEAVERAADRFRYRLHRTAFDAQWSAHREALLRFPTSDEELER